MSFWSTDGLSRVTATELDQFYVPYGWKADQSKRAIIWCHGAGGTYRSGPLETELAKALGTVWVNPTLGGGSSNLRAWGSDASLLNVVTDAWGAAKTRYNVNPDGCILWGGSMGGLTAALAAIDHSASVAALGLIIPNLDPEYVRLNDPNESDLNKTAIEAAYGVQEVPADKQGYQLGADLLATGIPTAMWYSTSDEFTPTVSSTTFATDSECEVHSLGAVGHSYLSLGLAEPYAFLKEHV